MIFIFVYIVGVDMLVYIVGVDVDLYIDLLIRLVFLLIVKIWFVLVRIVSIFIFDDLIVNSLLFLVSKLSCWDFSLVWLLYGDRIVVVSLVYGFEVSIFSMVLFGVCCMVWILV